MPTVQVAPTQPFGLYLDIPAQPGASAFLCEVRSGSELKFAVQVPAVQAGDSFHLLVPGGTLVPGQYELIVHDAAANNAAGPEVIRYAFQVVPK